MTIRNASPIKAPDKENVYTTGIHIKSYAIFTFNINGYITSWNEGATHIIGWPSDEAIGKQIKLLYTKEDVQKNRPKKDIKCVVNNGSYDAEARFVKKNGNTFLADITITQVYNEKTDKFNGFIAILKDITERRKLEEDQIDAIALLRREIVKRKNIEKALKESNAELEAFASAASHDLQEPLRMIISYLQIIDRRYRGLFDSDGKEFLEFAVDGAVRMRALINDLVEYARIDTTAKPHSNIDLNKVLQGALHNLQLSAKEAKVKITYENLPTVVGDEVQLSQLFQNLIANAIKFSNKKLAKVHIKAEEKENEYVFSVEDNGKGIDKKDFKRIFLIFKQLGSRKDRQGSGVGLAIAKKIVNRHYGKIWVESTEGEGSTFYFTIPLPIQSQKKGVTNA